MPLKMAGRCLSLRSLLRDSLMLLVGTVMGILLSRTLFDVGPENHLAITKRLTPAAVQVHQAGRVHLAASAKANTTANQVLISTSQPTVLVNTTQSTVRQKNGRGLTSMQSQRPKTLVQELGGNMRQSLFIGVVTSKALLLTRGIAINTTWGGQGTNLKFFSSEGTKAPPNLPVVSLAGTDDTYPPQKKVYRMLKYMYDHFINEFNWFMRADDDLYVRVGPLLQFLNKLDPSTDLYIGQPGIGKVNDWERIQLYPNEHYCMGGPGVILSRALLIKLAPHLEECLDNVVVSWNEDLEVGRCIMRRLGVQCTWSYELKDKFYQDYSMGEIFNSTDVYKDKKLQNILTLHPLKSPGLMYRVHQFYLELALSDAESKAEQIHWNLDRVSSMTGRAHAFS